MSCETASTGATVSTAVPAARPVDLAAVVDGLVDRPREHGASPSPDGSLVAVVTDAAGRPQVHVVGADDRDAPRRVVELGPGPGGPDPAVAVQWSPSGEWLAVAVAAGGGVPTSVWVVRPDGRDARCVADARVEGNATLGPWARDSGELLVTLAAPGPDADQPTVAVDPATGRRRVVAAGRLATVLDVAAGGRFLLVRDGPRGRRWCVVVDRERDRDHPVQPFGSAFAEAFPVTGHGSAAGAAPGGGSTDAGVLRPAPTGPGTVGYLRSDVGRQHPALLAVPLAADGRRGEGGVVAARPDADLELFAVDRGGALAALVWDVGGVSEVELLDLATYRSRPVTGLDGAVVTSVAFADRAPRLALTAEWADRPPATWWADTDAATARPLHSTTTTPPVAGDLVRPLPVRFEAFDGLPLGGWLYRPHDAAGPGPVVVYLHGGPEAEERPSFSPLFQALVAAGVSVFAPNVRGSTGRGRTFGHADDRGGRYAAIADVVAAAGTMVERRIAAPGRLVVGGRSYGGWLTLAVLTRFPELFAGGVSECGMSDLLSFYATTRPWIAAAAVSKYGDPDADRALLEDLSPRRAVAALAAPLLLVHGELDTNVPYTESTQLLAAARAAGVTGVELVTVPGEGHDFRGRDARAEVLRAWTGFVTRVLAG